MKTGTFLVLTLIVCSAFGAGETASAEISDSVLKRKMMELRNDRVDWNCSRATEVLAEHVNEAKVQKALRARLNTDDPQEQESILLLLFKAKGFKPDKSFIGIVLRRMQHWGRPERMVDGPAGDDGADFLIAHAKDYGDQIAAEIRDTFSIKDYSLWFQYALARALAKGHMLGRYLEKYNETFFTNLGIQLRSDKVPNNAELATMTFLFLGKLGVPTLKDVAKRSDEQAKGIAKLLLKHFDGKLSMRALNEDLHIGFDSEDTECDLDDCDLTKNVIHPHYFRFRPGVPEDE